MCLLKIMTDDNKVLFQNVTEIQIKNGSIIVVDILKRQNKLNGVLKKLDAVESIAIVEE